MIYVSTKYFYDVEVKLVKLSPYGSDVEQNSPEFARHKPKSVAFFESLPFDVPVSKGSHLIWENNLDLGEVIEVLLSSGK